MKMYKRMLWATLGALVGLCVVQLAYSEPEVSIGTQKSAQYSFGEQGVFMWGSYGQEKPRTLGQNHTTADLYSLGAGLEKCPMEDLCIDMRVGYTYIDETPKEPIVHEVAYTKLVGEHNVAHRPIPLSNPHEYHAAYDVDDGGLMFSVGLKYYITPHWSTTLSYRHLEVEEKWRIWDPIVIERTGGWWQGSYTRDLGGPEFTVNYRF